jgi:hypothetical protein
VRFLADENLNVAIVDGVRRHVPEADIITVQEAGLRGMPDERLLEWAAAENRAILTHDARTVPAAVYVGMESGLDFPGVFLIDNGLPVGVVVDDCRLIVACSTADEWRNSVTYLPL